MNLCPRISRLLLSFGPELPPASSRRDDVDLVYAPTDSCSPEGMVSPMAGSRVIDRGENDMFGFGVVASR